jgi:hypothetical protein
VSALLQVVEVVSPQEAPVDSNPFVGQAAVVPVQVSATSQSPVSARHTVVFGKNASEGQLPAPSQLSATSQIPAAGRQVVVVGE